MKKSLAPSGTVTVSDPKGLKFMQIVGSAYNKAMLSEKEAQRVNETPGLPDLIAEFINGHRERNNPFLKLISGSQDILIRPTNGQSTIAHAQDTFPGWIDSDFVNYGTDVKGQPTKETPVQVLEMVKDGTFTQIFGGFGENLDRLCLTQDQIIKLVEDHAKWLRPDGYATFFLFKVNGEFFVARVRRYVGGLQASVGRLSRDYVWRAEYRFRVVVPQL